MDSKSDLSAHLLELDAAGGKILEDFIISGFNLTKEAGDLREFAKSEMEKRRHTRRATRDSPFLLRILKRAEKIQDLVADSTAEFSDFFEKQKEIMTVAFNLANKEKEEKVSETSVSKILCQCCDTNNSVL